MEHSGTVPVDVRVRAGCRVVTVTGPNTGGKTAAIKAVGLAAVMARAGGCSALPHCIALRSTALLCTSIHLSKILSCVQPYSLMKVRTCTSLSLCCALPAFLISRSPSLLAATLSAGLYVLSSPPPRLPLFPSVFADIGDAQSLSSSLSTFSSHLARLTRIMEACDLVTALTPSRRPNALVLLDEVTCAAHLSVLPGHPPTLAVPSA